jgi:hypothetical protein
MAANDHTIYTGRSLRFTIGPLLRLDNTIVPLTGVTVLLVAKTGLEQSDVDAPVKYWFRTNSAGGVIAQKGMVMGRPSADGSTMVNATPAESYITVEFSNTDTLAMMPQTLLYEVVLIDAASPSRVHQMRAGMLTVVDTLIDDPVALQPAGA